MCLTIKNIAIEVKAIVPEALIATEDIVCYKTMYQKSNKPDELISEIRDSKYVLNEIQKEVDLKLLVSGYFDLDITSPTKTVNGGINEGYHSYADLMTAWSHFSPNNTNAQYINISSSFSHKIGNLVTNGIDALKNLVGKKEEETEVPELVITSQVIVRCFIPKGSKYYINEDSKEMVASSIRLAEIVDTKNLVLVDPNFKQ